MRKLVYATVTIIALGGVALLSWHHFRQRQQFLDPLSGSLSIPQISEERTLLTELDKSLELPELNQPMAMPPICVEFWRHVVNVKLSEWINDVGVIGWSHPEECKAKWSSSLDFIADRVSLNCAKKTDCKDALIAYRSRLADELTLARKNFIDMPLALLISKVISEIHGVGEDGHRPLPEFLNLIETLLNREQQFYQLKKLALAALIIREKLESNADLQGQLTERINSLIDAIHSEKKDDTEVLLMELHREFELGESGDAEISNYVSQNPKSAWARYFLAATQCRAHSRENCQKNLEAAIAEDPENETFRNSLSSLKSVTDDESLDKVVFETGMPIQVWAD